MRFGIFDHQDDGGSASASFEPTTIRPDMRMGARNAGTVLRWRVVDRDTQDTATQACKRGAVSPYRLFGRNSCPFAETAFDLIDDALPVALAGRGE